MIEMFQQEILYDKPSYVGTMGLVLSRLHMMRLHGGGIEADSKDKYDLTYADTDSLVYNIQHPDIYQWNNDNKQHFDLKGSKRGDLKDTTNDRKLAAIKMNVMVLS